MEQSFNESHTHKDFQKKVVIVGGTGFIGNYVAQRFSEMGYRVLIVSREICHIQWHTQDLKNAFEGAELVLNLAGKTINCRHNEANRKAILDSRIDTTRLIGNALNVCVAPPKLWINASATGVYLPSIDKQMTEDELVLGNDFLSDVVKRWENCFFEFQQTRTRQVALRTAVVLGKNGGALQPLVQLTRLGLGGKQASGKQMFSWIHVEDYFQILLFLLQTPAVQGVVNCASPNPVSNEQFMRSLRRTLHVPVGLPAPRIAIVLGARLIGTEPELLLNSSFVVPQKLQNAGFEFKFSTVDLALTDLLR